MAVYENLEETLTANKTFVSTTPLIMGLRTLQAILTVLFITSPQSEKTKTKNKTTPIEQLNPY